jgi:hypothetical protein
MRSTWLQAALVATILAASTAAGAPPSRPLALTPDQYQAVRQLEAQPEHVAVLHVQASYTSEYEATQAANVVANDITTAACQGGWLSAPIIFLILGAPL